MNECNSLRGEGRKKKRQLKTEGTDEVDEGRQEKKVG